MNAEDALDVLDDRFATDDDRRAAVSALRIVVATAEDATTRSVHRSTLYLDRLRSALDGRPV